MSPKEFAALPLSKAIPEYIKHMEAAHAAGIDLQMNNWAFVEDGKLCSVCMGGAALAGFLDFDGKAVIAAEDASWKRIGITAEVLNKRRSPIQLGYPGPDKVNCTEEEWKQIKTVGDSLRLCCYTSAYYEWQRMPMADWPLIEPLSNELSVLEDEHIQMNGLVGHEGMKIIKAQLAEFAAFLEKYGK